MGAWSKRDVNRLRDRMTEQGRDLAEIAEEIRHLTRCSRLAAFRMALGWSQPEAVERYADQAPGSAMDQPLLSRLEQFPAAGSRPPQATQIIALASIYGTAPLRLLDPAALDRLDEHERAVLIRCNNAFTSTPPNPPTTGGTALERTPAPLSPIPAWVRSFDRDEQLERQVEVAARKALRFAITMEGSNVGPETLGQLRDEVARLAVAYPRQPLPVLLGDLIELQDVAFRLLEGHQRPNETKDLYLLASALSGMLAKASHDLGDPHSAMAQARTARVCADNSGHTSLQAWVCGLQSGIAYRAGWTHRAVTYAKQGTKIANQENSSVSVWLAAGEARASARLADFDRARNAISAAEERRQRMERCDLDDLGGEFTFQPHRQHYLAAGTYVVIPGEERRAEEEATRSLELLGLEDPASRPFATEAGALCELALARIQMGELEGVEAALNPVLSLPANKRVYGVVESVKRVHSGLQLQKSPISREARSIQQRIEEFIQSPLRTLPH